MAGCGGMLGEAFYSTFNSDYNLKCSDVDLNEDCKGLCSSCGLNLNNDQCKCKKIESTQNLKELEKLIN